MDMPDVFYQIFFIIDLRKASIAFRFPGCPPPRRFFF